MDKDQRFILQPEAIRMVEGSSKGALRDRREKRLPLAEFSETGGVLHQFSAFVRSL